MGKKVFIYSYMRNNLGDDMFVDHVLKKHKNNLFYVWNNPHYLKTFKHYSNIVYPNCLLFYLDKIFRRFSKDDLGPIEKKWINKADVLLKIGGSVFMEPSNHHYKNIYKSVNQHLYILGANFGPYKTDLYLESVRKELYKAHDVCFRDRYSYNVFKDIPFVRVAPDILFSYGLKECIGEKTIGFSIVDVDKKPNLSISTYDYVLAVCKVVSFFLDAGYSIKLFSFCSYEGDLEILKRIKKEFKSDNRVKTVNYNGMNMSYILNEFCSCEIIFASRFHAMVLGWSAGKKVFPVVYNQKTTNVINDVGYTGLVWNLFENNSNIDIEQLTTGILNAKPLQNIKRLKKESNKHFDLFDKELEK